MRCDHRFTDNKTGAICEVFLFGPHDATLVVKSAKGHPIGEREFKLNYEPRFGYDVSDIKTMQDLATKIIDGYYDGTPTHQK